MKKRKSYEHNYKPVRLKVATYEALIRWMDAAIVAYDRGWTGKFWPGIAPTIDEAIAELTRRSEAQRKRGKGITALKRERKSEGQVQARNDS